MEDYFEVQLSEGEIKLPEDLDLEEYGILDGEPLLATIQTGVHDKPVISLEPFGQAVIRRIREVDDKLFELDFSDLCSTIF